MDYGYIPNLHVILLGDSQRAGAYLPYGKQLVRQLLASHQPYGKRVISPEEGILVEAWIGGDHRWVRITASGCPPYFMESGIVGLQDIGLGNLGLFGNDGIVHYNPAIRTYAADKRLLGTLSKPPALASKPTVEKDATPAMKATLDDEGNRDASSETTLAFKKLCAGRVPPSVFTGKLRLYFQAKYGARLANWKFSMNANNAPPSLDWRTKLNGDDFTFQFHSAHTGIFTDGEKRHWLIQLGVKGAYATPNVANVFKIVASPCSEKLRPLLLDPDVSDEDKERIEAYILSDSYPDPAFCISKSVSIPINSGLGYGWHFNWDGTAADIVGIEAINTGGSTYKHRSTHYRINILRDATKIDDPSNTPLENEERRWTFDMEQVEQKEWKNAKWFEVIASPDWAESKLAIFGTMLGAWFGDGAPIYAFYNRNELKVVRYSRSGGGSTIYNKIISEPALSRGATGWVTCTPPTPDPVVLGLNGCSYGAMTRVGDPVNTQFSVGDAVVAGSSESYSGAVTTYSEKTRTFNDGYYGGAYGITQAPVGDAPASIVTLGSGGCAVAVWGWSTTGHSTIPIGPGYIQNSSGVVADCSRTSSAYSFANSVRLLCVVPFADAEAVYLYGSNTEVITDIGTTEVRRVPMQLLARSIKMDGVEVAVSYQYYHVDDVGAFNLLSSAPYDNSSETYSQIGALFVSGNGVQPFTPVEAIASFFSGEPTTHVAQTFWTRTSAGLYRDTDGSGADLTGGYDTALNNKPWVFSGWV